MGFEKNYQVKNPSKQLNKSFYSKIIPLPAVTRGEGSLLGGGVNETKEILNPYFITGFTDAEGCFCTSIYKDEKYKTGCRVRSFFVIALNKRDRLLLLQ